jgi:hypothetical protein
LVADIAALFPSHRFAVIDAGQFPWVDNPEAFGAAV